MWTQFWDMNSGGKQKEKWSKIYIEAPEEEAKIIFYNRFRHNPERVTCTCCGEDYAISSSEKLEQETGFHRNCKYGYVNSKGEEVPKREAVEVGEWKPKEGYSQEWLETKGEYSQDYMTLEEYIKSDDAHFIFADDISEDKRHGDVPNEGYVWI